MSKITFKYLNEELKMAGISSEYEKIDNIPFLTVYHQHEWDHGYETYYGYNGTRREFYSDMKEMMNLLYSYISYHKITEFIITPWYSYDQFENNAKYYDNCFDIYEEISIFLKKNEIRRRSRTGIELLIDGNYDIIEMVVEGAFRGISTLRIFFKNNGVLLEPNHHFGFIFWTQNYLKEYMVLENLIRQVDGMKNLRLRQGR